eukprot:CAMPEP_0172315762 /NCGR_PEP_ID=MMETSP1058-20130122/26193_1 /TAXON_ID=83371 /ORGANISM="Detonula confervacea, Strain CCMP 353" /LENGTH=458 /DNA_ID=CAMNT_0013029923 /DNA_START=35 /DNA_END=1408 /DNA_ORIENTATION=-
MAAEEDPFELINKGNAFEAASDHWRSAEYYSRASVCLRTRADGISSQIRKGGEEVNDGASDDEKRKVVSLFRAQSLEYMYKARHCLLEALRFENDQDRSRTLEVAKTGTGSLDPLFSYISQEESEKRKHTFEILFSGGSESLLEIDTQVVEVGTQVDASNESEEIGTKEGNFAELPRTTSISNTNSSQIDSTENVKESSLSSDEIDDRQQSIESRLAKLDTSLLPNVPPPFVSGSRSSGGGGDISQKNRLEEIQRGLGRLGVSLPDSNGKTDLIPDNLSAEDQVKLIIQQAKDEVRFEKGTGEGGDSNGLLVDTTEFVDNDLIDENDSMFEGFEDEEYDIDALLSKAESLVAKSGMEAGRDGASPELVQIRKVQAILLEARLCLEMVHAKSSDEQILPNKLNEAVDVETREDMNDDHSEDTTVENDQPSSGSNLAARKKARERIENAQDCLNNLVKDW